MIAERLIESFLCLLVFLRRGQLEGTVICLSSVLSHSKADVPLTRDNSLILLDLSFKVTSIPKVNNDVSLMI